MQETKGKHGRGAVISTAAAVLLIPLTIAAGQFFPGSRKYYIISLLIILYLMLPFFAAFESRKPQPRELVIIAVMCAVAIGGRLAFFWLPQFKPMTAVVILSGIAFGGQTGFLTGAVTAFVSNFYFGQGPWTPWQMFALGLTGLISGLILKRDYVPRRALSVIPALYGAAATLIIYGGIVNPGSLLIAAGEITPQALLAAYAAGLPMDLVHAAATFVFLLIGAKPILKILCRVKTKYGLFA